MKKMYLCCPKHLKPSLRAEAEVQYQERYLYHDVLHEADVVFVIEEPTEEMNREIVKANRCGIPIVYLDDKFRNIEVYEALLSNDKRVSVVREKNMAKER